MSTTISGTLVEIRDNFIVLGGLVVGEALTATVTSQGGRWTAERVERGPVGDGG